MPKHLHLEEIAQPVAQIFGSRFKERRKALGLSQTKVFEDTGISPGYLSSIENGRANPTLDLMVKLSEAVGMEIWDMLRPAADKDSTSGKSAPKV